MNQRTLFYYIISMCMLKKKWMPKKCAAIIIHGVQIECSLWFFVGAPFCKAIRRDFPSNPNKQHLTDLGYAVTWCVKVIHASSAGLQRPKRKFYSISIHWNAVMNNLLFRIKCVLFCFLQFLWSIFFHQKTFPWLLFTPGARQKLWREICSWIFWEI